MIWITALLVALCVAVLQTENCVQNVLQATQFSVIILLLAIPAGFLIAWMARDELVSGRKWFKLIIILSAVLGILFFIFERNEISFSLAFILITAFISYWKSFDKKWTKRRI